MKFRFYTSLLFIAVFSSPVFSQKYSNEFLQIGVGARSHGLSGAMAAHANDISAAFWNPAGLTAVEAPFQIAAQHAEWFAGVANYDYLAFGKKIGGERNAFIGLSLIRMAVDQIPYTIRLVNPDGSINYDNVTEFSAADYGALFSYARQLKNNRWSVGGSAKVIRRVVGDIGGAWGFGLDAGLQYRAGAWQFGAMGRDLTSTFNAWSFDLTEEEKQVYTATGNEIPESSLEVTRPRLILGTAWSHRFGEKISLLAALDADFTTDGRRNVLVSSKAFNLDPHLGLEAGYGGFLFLRAGAGNFQKIKKDIFSEKESLTLQPNFGVGLKLGRFSIDYALTNIGQVSEVLYSHVFSLMLDLKKKE